VSFETYPLLFRKHGWLVSIIPLICCREHDQGLSGIRATAVRVDVSLQISQPEPPELAEAYAVDLTPPRHANNCLGMDADQASRLRAIK